MSYGLQLGWGDYRRMYSRRGLGGTHKERTITLDQGSLDLRFGLEIQFGEAGRLPIRNIFFCAYSRAWSWRERGNYMGIISQYCGTHWSF